MPEVDHYESVRQKMSIDEVGTPKHKKTIEFLKVLYNEEEIELLDHFDRGYQLLTAVNLAKKSGWVKERVKKILKSLSKRGALFTLGRSYMLLNLVPGFFEHYILTRGDTEENTIKVAKYFRWAFLNLTPQMFNNMKLKKKPLWLPKLSYDAEEKIIEIDESIPMKDQKIFTGELVRDLIDQNEYFAKVYCQCREVAKMSGEPCQHAPEELGCLLCGLTAKVGVSQGWAVEIPTKEDAIQYAKDCEKAGLIHYGMNLGPITFICNCCRDCCTGLRGMVVHSLPYGRSNFDPRWIAEKCKFCEKCIKMCPMGAVSRQYPVKDEKDQISFNLSICLGCGVCATNCPQEAITLVKVRTDDTPEMSGFAKQITEALLRF
ncbi:MAG: 4Fe-4S binding protein [Candidatus Helarchaeota archaeon]|nr:4Fe-4S binding protein [Candidatus Helarchaeota archaeon]